MEVVNNVNTNRHDSGCILPHEPTRTFLGVSNVLIRILHVTKQSLMLKIAMGRVGICVTVAADIPLDQADMMLVVEVMSDTTQLLRLHKISQHGNSVLMCLSLISFWYETTELLIAIFCVIQCYDKLMKHGQVFFDLDVVLLIV